MIIDYAHQRDRDDHFGRFNAHKLFDSQLWRESQPMDKPIREVNRIEEYRRKRDILDGLT